MSKPHNMIWFNKLSESDSSRSNKRRKENIKEDTKNGKEPTVPTKTEMAAEKKEEAKKKKEKIKPTEALKTFAKKRHDGAKKITENALEKGGPALLTYNHFRVKLSYYRSVVDGKFDAKALNKEYKQLMSVLAEYSKDISKINQKTFQELVGKIEVVGELLIKGGKNE